MRVMGSADEVDPSDVRAAGRRPDLRLPFFDEIGERFDPLVEGIQVRVVRSSDEVDPADVCAASDEAGFLFFREHAAVGVDDEGGGKDARPLSQRGVARWLIVWAMTSGSKRG